MSIHYYFDISAVLVTLVYLGKYIENHISKRATNVLNEIASIQPKTAILKQTGLTVSVNELKIHDLVLVPIGSQIPIDSIIVEGQTTIDESAITGEYLPVHKTKSADVIGGTINISDEITVSVTKISSETLIAGIINTIELASMQKIKIQRIVDKVSAYFIPTIILISIVALII